jgi:hypothetical protein
MRGRDWQSEHLRYLSHFSDGGSGLRHRNEPLAAGVELTDGGDHNRVERVEPSARFVAASCSSFQLKTGGFGSPAESFSRDVGTRASRRWDAAATSTPAGSSADHAASR